MMTCKPLLWLFIFVLLTVAPAYTQTRFDPLKPYLKLDTAGIDFDYDYWTVQQENIYYVVVWSRNSNTFKQIQSSEDSLHLLKYYRAGINYYCENHPEDQTADVFGLDPYHPNEFICETKGYYPIRQIPDPPGNAFLTRSFDRNNPKLGLWVKPFLTTEQMYSRIEYDNRDRIYICYGDSIWYGATTVYTFVDVYDGMDMRAWHCDSVFGLRKEYDHLIAHCLKNGKNGVSVMSTDSLVLRMNGTFTFTENSSCIEFIQRTNSSEIRQVYFKKHHYLSPEMREIEYGANYYTGQYYTADDGAYILYNIPQKKVITEADYLFFLQAEEDCIVMNKNKEGGYTTCLYKHCMPVDSSFDIYLDYHTDIFLCTKRGDEEKDYALRYQRNDFIVNTRFGQEKTFARSFHILFNLSGSVSSEAYNYFNVIYTSGKHYLLAANIESATNFNSGFLNAAVYDMEGTIVYRHKKSFRDYDYELPDTDESSDMYDAVLTFYKDSEKTDPEKTVTLVH